MANIFDDILAELKDLNKNLAALGKGGAAKADDDKGEEKSSRGRGRSTKDKDEDRGSSRSSKDDDRGSSRRSSKELDYETYASAVRKFFDQPQTDEGDRENDARRDYLAPLLKDMKYDSVKDVKDVRDMQDILDHLEKYEEKGSRRSRSRDI